MFPVCPAGSNHMAGTLFLAVVRIKGYNMRYEKVGVWLCKEDA